MLIVDDSEIIQKHLMDRLALIGGAQVVGLAQDATEAVKSVHALKPDVVILDIQLRTGTGFDVLEKIKEDSERPIIIVLTNFAHPLYKRKSLEAGADYFMDKSIEFERIPRIFGQLLKGCSKKEREQMP